LDLSTAEWLASVADPKGLASLKKQSSDPAAAKAVAGQFGALLMQGVMQGSDGAAISMAGDGVGGNVVSALFASTMSLAAMSGDKLGLADMLFRAIETKQGAPAAGKENQASTLSRPTRSDAAASPSRGALGGLSLVPYWQGDGARRTTCRRLPGRLRRRSSLSSSKFAPW
jgi:hypothetical protein